MNLIIHTEREVISIVSSERVPISINKKNIEQAVSSVVNLLKQIFGYYIDFF